MKVMSVKILREFWKNHADAEQPLKSWYEEANKASWGSPADVKARYPKASIIMASQHYRVRKRGSMNSIM
jgi:mRNA interferase HigB